MPVHNADIAAIFEEIANLLEIEGANPFYIRAYRTIQPGPGLHCHTVKTLRFQ